MTVQRVSAIVSRTAIVCTALAMGSLAWAQTDSRDRTGDQRTCSNRTLQGAYGFAAEGALLGIPKLPPQAPFRSIGMAHFDGNGNLTWLERTVINGKLQNSDWTAASGTYSVNPNCTGTAVVVTPNSRDPLQLAFIVVKAGKEVRTMLETDAVSTVFEKVE